MAGNTRGKIKEHLEGVHRNFDWSKVHLEKTLVLIADHKPELSESIGALGKAIDALDEMTQKIYAMI